MYSHLPRFLQVKNHLTEWTCLSAPRGFVKAEATPGQARLGTPDLKTPWRWEKTPSSPYTSDSELTAATPPGAELGGGAGTTGTTKKTWPSL